MRRQKEVTTKMNREIESRNDNNRHHQRQAENRHSPNRYFYRAFSVFATHIHSTEEHCDTSSSLCSVQCSYYHITWQK